MEAVLTTLTFWFIAGLIVFILIIISIIGTWFEAREMRKELEQMNAYLATLNDNLIIGFQNNDRQSRNFLEPAALVPAFLSCRSCRALPPCGACALPPALCCRPCRAVSPLWSLCAPCAVFGANCVRNKGGFLSGVPLFLEH